jgi:tRNA(Ile)-lysidine synthase
MLHLLVRLRARQPFTLCVGHLDHGLRGAEGAEDETFVKDLAGRFALPYRSGRVSLERRPGDSSSLEERARTARRAFLIRAAEEMSCKRIALGHTMDDQAETVLMWLLRGTGRGGLAGMSPVTGERIIRPLIKVRREEIRRRLQELGEPCREDLSNEDLDRTRNRIRHRIIPLIESEFPGSVETLAGQTSILAAEDSCLDQAAAECLGGDEVELPSDRLASAPRALARRAVRLVAGRRGLDPRLLDRDHIERILDLGEEGAEGRGADLPGGWRAEKRGNRVVFIDRERNGEPER